MSCADSAFTQINLANLKKKFEKNATNPFIILAYKYSFKSV